ncbi:g7421 [Coccomyxa elongata]
MPSRRPFTRIDVGVQCFGGKILSTLFQRDVEERSNEEIVIEDLEATSNDLENIVLQEISLPGDGCKVQILYTRNAEVSAPVLSQLIEKVGWPKRPAKKLETALLGSYLVSSVVRRELDPSGATTNEQLIGLIRCTSDQVFNATIWDVLVDPEYQGKGIGRFLVIKTVEALKREQIGNICLFADAEAVGFYEQLGFKCDPDGVRGMFWSQ